MQSHNQTECLPLYTKLEPYMLTLVLRFTFIFFVVLTKNMTCHTRETSNYTQNRKNRWKKQTTKQTHNDCRTKRPTERKVKISRSKWWLARFKHYIEGVNRKDVQPLIKRKKTTGETYCGKTKYYSKIYIRQSATNFWLHETLRGKTLHFRKKWNSGFWKTLQRVLSTGYSSKPSMAVEDSSFGS